MRTMACQLCDSRDHEHLVTFPDDPYLKRLSGLADYSISYVVCRDCGFVFQNPTLEPHELDEMYGTQYRRSMPDETFIEKNSVFTDGRVRWIEKGLGGEVGAGKRVLDVGCGAGVLLNSFRSRGWQARGIEPTSAYAEFGRRRFGIDIIPGFFTKDSFPGERFDLLTLSQVLEHAPDPAAMLRDCREKLADGGHLFVGVPTLLRPQRPIHPNTLAGPHLSIFSLPTLTRLLHRERFEVVMADCDFKGLMVLARPVPQAAAAALKTEAPDTIKERLAAWMDDKSLYNQNMAALRTRWPQLAKRMDCDIPLCDLETARQADGQWNVRFTAQDGARAWMYGADAHDCVRKTLDRYPLGTEGLIVLFGFGLGSMVQALLERMQRGHVLVVYERHEAFFRLALELLDLRALLEDKRVELAVGDQLSQLDHLLAVHSRKYMLTNRLLLLRQSTISRIDPDGYKKAHDRVGERLKVIKVNKNTWMGLGPLMLKNSLENMHLIMAMPGVKRLKELFRGVPAIIVSAGPSLQRNFPLLKEAEGRAVVIACDTVLRLLVPYGITPDFIMTADPQETSYRKFRDIPMSPESSIVCHPINYPEMISTFAGRRFAIGSNLSLYQWLAPSWPDKGTIDFGSQSVAHMAFNLACLIGADPIIFVGQDFCYYENKKYAGHLSKGSPWERRVQKGKNKTVPAADIFGEPVETETLFESFKVLMEDLIKRSGRRCINATEGGLGLKGTGLMTLHDALREYGAADTIDIKGRIRSVSQEETEIDVSRLLRDVDHARKQAEELIRDSEKVLKYSKQASRVSTKEKPGTDRYSRLSELIEKRTQRVRQQEQFLSRLGEFALALDLYMSSQQVIDIDSVEDPHERFKKQIARAKVYYRGLLRVLKPFAQGLKVLHQRVEELRSLNTAVPSTLNDRVSTMARYKRLSYYDHATKVAEDILAQRADHPEALYAKGEIALTCHHPIEAERCFSMIPATSKRPSRLEEFHAEARTKADTWRQKVQEALEQFRAPHALDNANFYFRLGEFDKAVELYQAVVDASPSWEGYYHLAHAFIAKEDRDQAVAMLEQALALSPDNSVLYRDLGLLALDNDQEDLAEGFWLEAAQLKPEDPRPYELLSDLYIRQGALAKASQTLEALTQLEPNRQEFVAKLAMVYQALISKPEGACPAA